MGEGQGSVEGVQTLATKVNIEYCGGLADSHCVQVATLCCDKQRTFFAEF